MSVYFFSRQTIQPMSDGSRINASFSFLFLFTSNSQSLTSIATKLSKYLPSFSLLSLSRNTYAYILDEEVVDATTLQYQSLGRYQLTEKVRISLRHILSREKKKKWQQLNTKKRSRERMRPSVAVFSSI